MRAKRRDSDDIVEKKAGLRSIQYDLFPSLCVISQLPVHGSYSPTYPVHCQSGRGEMSGTEYCLEIV